MEDLKGLLPATSLSQISQSPMMSQADLYAVTHAPMYLTDFGRLDRVDVERGWIGPLQLSRLLAGDLDLAGEFAIVDALTSDALGVETFVTLAVLSQAMKTVGAIPTPTFRYRDYEGSRNQDHYRLFHCYHSTFVYGLLCSILMLKHVDDRRIEPGLSTMGSGGFDEWDGFSSGLTDEHRCVMHTFDRWSQRLEQRGVAFGSDDLLRGVIDAYLLRHVGNSGRLDSSLRFLRLGEAVSASPVDRSIRALINTRLMMSGSDLTI